MRVSYQGGHLRCVKRKDGPPRWEFLLRENDLLGHRIRRNTVIGTLDQYPTEELAQTVVNGLRMHINDVRNRQREQPILLTHLIDHYMSAELASDTDWRSHATRMVYREFLTRWIKPHWGSMNIREVRTVAVVG
jgi:integrase